MATYSTKSSNIHGTFPTLKDNCRNLARNTPEKVQEVPVDFGEVASALDYIASKLHQRNMELADKICKEAWFKMNSRTLCKRLWSETDLTKWATEKTEDGIVKKASMAFSSGCSILQKIQQYINKIGPVVNVIDDISMMFIEDQYKITIDSEKIDSGSSIKSDTEEGLRQFERLMDIVKQINDFVPAGFNEYIKFNVEVFEKSKELFEIAKHYANAIAELARDTENLWDEAINNDSSWYNITQSLSRNMDVDALLDYMEKYKKRREQENKMRDRDRSEINRQR